MLTKTKIKNLLSAIALLAVIFFITSIPSTAFAAIPFTQNVQIGETDLNDSINSGSLGTYLQAIYKYAIGAVGILATVVMMFGGAMWITAAGNNERVSSAKAWIGASLTGLVLTLSSYTILYLVNPNTLTFRPIELEKPEEITIAKKDCQWYNDRATCKDVPNFPITSKDEDCEINNDDGVCCCVAPAPVVSVEADGLVWQTDEIKLQYDDAADTTKNLLSCIRNKLDTTCGDTCGQISSISDSKYPGDDMAQCNTTPCPPDCAHKCESCHYGGGDSPTESLAADFGDESNASQIIAAAESCGASTYFETTHVHVSLGCSGL